MLRGILESCLQLTFRYLHIYLLLHDNHLRTLPRLVPMYGHVSCTKLNVKAYFYFLEMPYFLPKLKMICCWHDMLILFGCTMTLSFSYKLIINMFIYIFFIIYINNFTNLVIIINNWKLNNWKRKNSYPWLSAICRTHDLFQQLLIWLSGQ